MRLDKWLWVARCCKTRSFASSLCLQGRITVNGKTAEKAHFLKVGDLIGVPGGRRGRRMLNVIAFSDKRLSPSEAAALYQELTPFDDSEEFDISEEEDSMIE